MPCAARELCAIPDRTPDTPDSREHSGKCGGRLQGSCGEPEDLDSNEPRHRICPVCIAPKYSAKGASKAPAGKRKQPDTEGHGAISLKSEKSGSGKKTADRSTPPTRLAIAQKLEFLRLLDQGVNRNNIPDRCTCSLRTVSSIKENRKEIERQAASGSFRTFRSQRRICSGD